MFDPESLAPSRTTDMSFHPFTSRLASTTPKPNKFLVKPSNVIVLHNEDAILECIITGYPKPQVEWYKDGTKITLTQNGQYSKYGASSLNVSGAQAADSGKYECVMGTDRAEASLQVLGTNFQLFMFFIICMYRYL
jgi:hypothetical protein